MSTRVIFYTLLGLLMLDSLLEMTFVARTVYVLHRAGGGSIDIAYNGSDFSLHGKPANPLTKQGHASNGAGGTALILVGIVGFLTFPLLQQNRSGFLGRWTRFALPFWLVISVLSMLLTFGVLIAVFVITHDHAGQTINEAVASQLHNKPYPNQVPYPLLSWTPENWLNAVLKLDIVHPAQRSAIKSLRNVQRAWRWNLIPLFLLGLAVCIMGFIEARKFKKGDATARSQPQFNKERDVESMEEVHRDGTTPILTQTDKPAAEATTSPVKESDRYA